MLLNVFEIDTFFVRMFMYKYHQKQVPYLPNILTHLPLVPHICAVNWVSIGLDNGLSPIRRQAII